MLLAYFFYQSQIAVVCLLPVGIIVLYDQWKSWRKQVLLEIEVAFKDWLYYVRDGIRGGKSFEQAMILCQADFYKMIGVRHSFLYFLEQIYRGVELQIPVEDSIRKFGDETGIEVVMHFSVVFEIARKQGGHMAAILERTIQQIHGRTILRQEIESMIQAKKLEQRIMCIMPLGIMLFVGKASGGYFTSLYHNLQGILIMSACMIIYLFGVWWGEKLTEVHI